MASTYLMNPAAAVHTASEHHVVHTTQRTLRYLLSTIPIVAGADKFTNFLAHWEAYLNPMVLDVVPVTAGTFMRLVGIIEIAAGVLVFLRPRLGAFVVMAWLLAIAGQLLIWGQFLDIAVRDIVIAVGGAWTLARLTPFAERVKDESAG